MAVGDNQGTVYTGNEGHQRAFIFGNPTTKPQEDLINLAIKNEGDKVKIAEAQAKKQQATKENLAKKMQDMPEHFYAHDPEIKEQQNKILKMGADIMSNGADPFTGTDPLSLEFRKQFTRHEKMAEYSKQIKSLFEADRNSFNPDKFTLDSYNTRMNFYPTVKLNKAVDEGLLPPNLVPKNPVLDLTGEYGKLASAISAENPNPTPAEINQHVTNMSNNPNLPDLKPAWQASYNKLSPNDKAAIDKQAADQGIDPLIALGVKQFTPYFAAKEFDLNKFMKENPFVGDITEGQHGTMDPLGTYTSSGSRVKDLSDKKALEQATSKIQLYPELYQHLLKNVKQDDGTPITNEHQAAQWLADYGKANYQTEIKKTSDMKRNFGAGNNANGMSEKERQKDSDFWYAAAMRTDNAITEPYLSRVMDKFKWTRDEAQTWLMEQAAEFMRGTKDAKGRTIHNANVILPGESAMQYKNPATGEMEDVSPNSPHIRLDLGTQGKKKTQKIVNGEVVNGEEQVFDDQGSDYWNINQNEPNYIEKSAADSHWAQAIKLKGAFEKMLDSTLKQEASTFDTTTNEEARGVVPEVSNKGKLYKKGSNSTNSNPQAPPVKGGADDF